jgi:glycosyltransferase involved in cell wall biosynthesis
MAGGLDEANGIRMALEAFSLLRGAHFRFRIAGDGPLAAAVRCAAATDRRIEYLGFIPFERVLSLYSQSDVLMNLRITRALDTRFLFPSKLMECLASGTPVITTCTGHVEHELGGLVWLLRNEQPQDLARLIETVSHEPADVRLERAARARAYVAANKTWRAQAERVRVFLADLAGQRCVPARRVQS